jgi:hypothetical protein
VSPESTPDEVDAPTPTPTPARPTGASGDARRRLIRLAVFGVVAAIAGLVVWPKVPRAQEVRLHFGIGASRVVSATARVGHAGAWDREKTWRFDASTGAPSSLVWSFELPNGEADVEVEVSSAVAIAQQTVHVDLEGGETNVELEPTLRSLVR